jgi:hypothetical protein
MVVIILSAVLLIAMVAGGYYNKLFGAAVTLVWVLISAVVATTFYRPLASFVRAQVAGEGKELFLDGLVEPTFFMALFAITWHVFYMLGNRYFRKPPKLPKTLNDFGGAAIGLVTGIFLSGFMVVSFYMLPISGSWGVGRPAAFPVHDWFVGTMVQASDALGGAYELDEQNFFANQIAYDKYRDPNYVMNQGDYEKYLSVQRALAGGTEPGDSERE